MSSSDGKKKKNDERGSKEDTSLYWSSLKAPIVKQIACGKDRTIMLLSTGELYSWYVFLNLAFFLSHLKSKYHIEWTKTLQSVI